MQLCASAAKLRGGGPILIFGVKAMGMCRVTTMAHRRSALLLGNMGRQPRLFAGLNVLDLEVAAIGDDIDILDIENGAGRLGGLFQQAHVHDLIGHGLLDDHLVLRVDQPARQLRARAERDQHRHRRQRPEKYFGELAEQCTGGKKKDGGITNLADMKASLRMNCVPEFLLDGKIPPYEDFLEEWRRLMALKIKQ